MGVLLDTTREVVRLLVARSKSMQVPTRLRNSFIDPTYAKEAIMYFHSVKNACQIKVKLVLTHTKVSTTK